MGSPAQNEMKLIFEYAKSCKFILETGSGVSTEIFSGIAKSTDAKVVSIDLNKIGKQFELVEYLT